MPLLLNEISATRLGTLDREKTVFLLPVGPIEDHGLHLPLGQDLNEARELSSRLAAKVETEFSGWSAVVAPPAPLGVNADTTGFALTVRPFVVRDYVLDWCSSLARYGFRYFVCVSGHLGPRQLTALEEASKALPRRVGWFKRGGLFSGKKNRAVLVSASSALVTGRDVRRSPLWPDPEEHGGSRDTSVALALTPERVDPSYKNLPANEPGEGFLGRAMLRWTHRRTDYWGDPSGASKEKGEKELEARATRIFTELRPVLNGAPPRSRFRSWYSVFPPNWSFFHGWLLAVVLMILMLVYAYLLTESISRFTAW